MKPHKIFLTLAAGLIAAPIASRAQGPQPKITEIATIPGVDVWASLKMPNGRIILYTTGDSILAYSMTTKRSTLVTRGFEYDLAISPAGDQIAYRRLTEDGKSSRVWTIAVDAGTGIATGPAKRVSMSEADSPSFSIDGKQIAFFAAGSATPGAGFKMTDGQDLAVIPATGGPQRTLAHFSFANENSTAQSPTWSADGKWIYVAVGEDSSTSIERIPTTGGKREVLFSHPSHGEFESTIDGRIAFYQPGEDRMAYATATGVRGAFKIPPYSWAPVVLGFPKTLLVKTDLPLQLHVLDPNSGKTRDIPYVGERAHYITWSPDQKHLSFMEGSGDSQQYVVMNADGSGIRRFPLGYTTISPVWSPDNVNLAFVGDSGREYLVLNLASGSTRVLAKVPSPSHAGGISWQQDGQSFITTNYVGGHNVSPSNWKVVEVRLDGRQRVVRDFSTDFPGMTSLLTTSSKQVLVLYSAPWPKGIIKLLQVALEGGAPRALSVPALDAETTVGFSTVSEKALVLNLYASGQFSGNLVISLVGDSTLVLRSNSQSALAGMNILDPDGKHLITFAAKSGTNAVTVSSVPLNGSPARVIGQIADPRPGLWSPSSMSPDGKSYAFFSAGTPTSHIYDVDLTPILNLIKKP